MAGLEYAREHGTKSGRPVGRPKKVFDHEEVVRLRQRGMSVRAIAEQLEIGSGTVVRALKNFASQTEPLPPQMVRGPVLIMPNGRLAHGVIGCLSRISESVTSVFSTWASGKRPLYRGSAGMGGGDLWAHPEEFYPGLEEGS
jgi:hypothetical protein